tara:strand:+ start:154 stop:537 length:384 start_codon:yes stop_codon:yes gene_type:complete
MAIDLLSKFSVTKKVDSKESIDMISDILIAKEKVDLAYTHVRDKVWFTNKRIIALDVKGLTGSKKEFRMFPYSQITSFTIETAGTFDLDCDFHIFISGLGEIVVKFAKSIDIKEIGLYMSKKVLQDK